MITLPDFRHRQILFLDASDFASCELKFRNENIVILDGGKTRDKVPVRHLLAIFIIGEITITSKMIQKCMSSGASVFLLKRNMETYAAIGAYAEGNYLLRQRQYALSPQEDLRIAREIVKNKITNSLALLRSVNTEVRGIKRTVYKREVFEKIDAAKDLSSLRGIEGASGKEFFGAYFSDIGWYKRAARAKVDENNILLDMGYNFLFHFTDSLLRVFGFDTYKGVYHQLFFQRKSLSCDMMEPFRCIIDRSIVKMHRLGQFDAKDFTFSKGRYALSYSRSGKYARILLGEILNYKMDMYEFVRGYYYFLLNGEGDMPKFVIR